jgi:hypothetical protein
VGLTYVNPREKTQGSEDDFRRQSHGVCNESGNLVEQPRMDRERTEQRSDPPLMIISGCRP